MQGELDLTIVIPCFNEEESLPLLGEDIETVTKKSRIQFILVDNGSTDGTFRAMQSSLCSNGMVQLVRLNLNQGYGGGILFGLEHARTRLVGWMHADMQTRPQELLSISLPDNGDFFFKGQRFGRSLSDKVFTSGMSWLETVLFRTRLFDINAQPTIFPRKYLDHWKPLPTDFSLDLHTYVSARRDELPILRSPVRFGVRVKGRSSWNDGLRSRIKFIRRTFNYSMQLRRGINANHQAPREHSC